MSRYTLIDIETTLDAVENTPRKSLPWHSSYGQVKKNKENFAQFCGDNIGQFGGGVAKKWLVVTTPPPTIIHDGWFRQGLVQTMMVQPPDSYHGNARPP